MAQDKSGYVPIAENSPPLNYGFGQPNPAGFVLPPPDYTGMPVGPGGPPFPPPGAFGHPMYNSGAPGYPPAPIPDMSHYGQVPPNQAPYNPEPPNQTPYQYTPSKCFQYRWTVRYYFTNICLLFYPQISQTNFSGVTSRLQTTATRRSWCPGSTTKPSDEPSSERSGFRST